MFSFLKFFEIGDGINQVNRHKKNKIAKAANAIPNQTYELFERVKYF